MQIVWDERKRLANAEKHGFDFADLTMDFFISARIFPAKKGRFVAVGRCAEVTITVVFARLGREAISVVSMRTANRKERRLT